MKESSISISLKVAMIGSATFVCIGGFTALIEIDHINKVLDANSKFNATRTAGMAEYQTRVSEYDKTNTQIENGLNTERSTRIPIINMHKKRTQTPTPTPTLNVTPLP